MKYRVKLPESKEGFNGPLYRVNYLKDLEGTLTEDKAEALIITNESDLIKAKTIARDIEYHHGGTSIWIEVEHILESDYECTIKITEENGEGTTVRNITLTSEDLKNEHPNFGENDYDSPYDYCSDMLLEYRDDNGGVFMVSIEYTEDHGKTWESVCKNLLLL